MLSKRIAIPVLVTTLLLSGCTVDGFKDEEKKRMAWDAVQCKEYGRKKGVMESTKINLEIIRDEIHPEEMTNARQWADRLQKADTVKDAMVYESGEGFSRMCSGWLWEHYKKTDEYKSGYDDFTHKDAEDAGVIKKK